MVRTIAFASDHTVYGGQEEIAAMIAASGEDVQPLYLGPTTADAVDYPDYAEKVTMAVKAGEADLGILLCWTGIGMSIAANKIHGIRAALCHDQTTARLTRLHNDSNVLCVGYGVVGKEVLRDIITTFLSTEFSNKERHQVRVDKVMALETKTD
ncbi:unnamed protein product [Phytomonas sp. Hart1]|nr:unnamed protein product [Phytomonas sp. Hart1]|eukprot:CCW68636.1 unnamed protein product [Phytomonas sp. isolate Hart1]